MNEKVGFVRKSAKWAAVGCVLAGVSLSCTSPSDDVEAKQGDKPNILVIMGDDIGMWNIGAYHRGMMAGTTPHIDKLAAEGAIFTNITQKRVARQVVQTSSLANFRSVPV